MVDLLLIAGIWAAAFMIAFGPEWIKAARKKAAIRRADAELHAKFERIILRGVEMPEGLIEVTPEQNADLWAALKATSKKYGVYPRRFEHTWIVKEGEGYHVQGVELTPSEECIAQIGEEAA